MFNTKPCKQSDSGPGQGNEGELGWPVLVDKIKIGSPVPLPDDPSDHREPPNGWAGENNYPDEDDPPYFNSPRPPKVFCGVYTYHKKHYLLEAATHTWAYRCDGFLAFSDLTDPTIGAVDLPHYGEETYQNMWQKVRSIWAYIYTHYYNQFVSQAADKFHFNNNEGLIFYGANTTTK